MQSISKTVPLNHCTRHSISKTVPLMGLALCAGLITHHKRACWGPSSFQHVNASNVLRRSNLCWYHKGFLTRHRIKALSTHWHLESASQKAKPKLQVPWPIVLSTFIQPLSSFSKLGIFRSFAKSCRQCGQRFIKSVQGLGLHSSTAPHSYQFVRAS